MSMLMLHRKSSRTTMARNGQTMRRTRLPFGTRLAKAGRCAILLKQRRSWARRAATPAGKGAAFDPRPRAQAPARSDRVAARTDASGRLSRRLGGSRRSLRDRWRRRSLVSLAWQHWRAIVPPQAQIPASLAGSVPDLGAQPSRQIEHSLRRGHCAVCSGDDLVDQAGDGSFHGQRDAVVEQRLAAVDRQGRKVLDVDVAADLAVVFDVEPDENQVRARLRDSFQRRAEFGAGVAPGRAQGDDGRRGAFRPAPYLRCGIVTLRRYDGHGRTATCDSELMIVDQRREGARATGSLLRLRLRGRRARPPGVSRRQRPPTARCYARFGARSRRSVASSRCARAARSRSWSSPILPTAK